MRELNVDFETYSEQEIKYGSFRYAEDKTTELICVAFGFEGEEAELWYPGMSPPIRLVEHIKAGGLIRAWNATFEYAIFNYVCHRLYGWPKVKIEQMICTQAEALALSLPASLGMAAEALGTSEQKDKLGKRLITKLCKPRKPTKNLPHTRVTKEIDAESFELMYKYCIQDVKAEQSVKALLPRELSKPELDLFHLTLRINERGINIDMDLVNAILKAKDAYQIRLNKEIEEITNGELTSTGSRPRSLKWLANNGLFLKGYTKGDIQAALTGESLTPEVRRFLEIRSELSRTPIKKFDFIENAICSDGTLKNNIIFHKATTGRFAGSGFQIQNLTRDSSDDTEKLIETFLSGEGLDSINVYNEAIKLTRTVICAPEGKKLVVSDFSSIENRVIAWLAGDYETLNDFVEGIDQYKTAASSIYSVEYENVNKDQRQLGKIAVLSCGFGGGWKTFRTVCSDSWGINISEDEAQEIVEGYRAKYHKIVSLWYGLYEAALDAVARPGVVCNYGLIKFRVQGEYLYMRLPNGRFVTYYKPLLKMVMTPWGKEKLALTHMGQNTYTRKWERLVVIPGRLTENAVQAVARDFLTESMFRCEKAGYEIIACVHDENVTQVPEDFGSIEELDKIMAEVVPWGVGCPIAAEGFEGKRYRK